ncbi:MAG TPA: ABC transporter permease [Terriglobales bacterium]|jgi:putative ABC transport system permease protein
MSLIRRVLNLQRRKKLDAEIQAELQSHIEMAVEDGIRRGISEQQARREAILRFGNTGLVHESVADEDMFLSLNSICSDVLYAFRQLRRSPAFSLPAVLTLAIGIGASTAVFSLVQAFLLRPLPYPDASRLVVLWEQLRVLGIDRFPAPVADFVDYKNENRVFDDMGAVEDAHFVLRADDYPERIFAVRTTANIFSMMGLRPALGRAFSPSENQPGHENVVVLSNVIWRERFGSDRAIVGKDIVLDGKNYQVVGVLACNARFSLGYPRMPDIWVPLPLVADPARNTGQLQMVARLGAGVLLDQAQRQIDILAARLERQYHIQMGPHGEDPGYGVRLVPLHQELSGNLREPLMMMLGAAALIFLIACVNIANLMLSHGVSREREFAIRISLGAGRVRLVRLVVAEAIVIALAGMTLGIGIAWAVSALLVNLSPYEMASFLAVSLDAKVLGYAVGLGLVAMMLFGFMPGLLIARRARFVAARTGHQVLSERRSRSLRSILVVVETALSVTLLLGAGMLIHSFLRLQDVPLGFEPNGILTAQINLPPSYSTRTAPSQFYERLLEQVRSIAAIKGVAATTMLPASDRLLHDPFSIEGRPWQPFGAARVPQFANHQAVSTDYFRVMRIGMRKGRVFSTQDKDGSQPVAMVNEMIVRGFWPGENPIGKHLMLGAPRPGIPWLNVVGIVADVRSGGATAETLPEIYTPMTQTPSAAMALVLDTKLDDPASVASDLRDAVRAIDRGIPLERVATYEELLGTQFAPRRYQMFLLASFAGLAILLAAVGLYGVVSYAVTQRKGEIGLRMAFGASLQDVTAMVLKQVFLLAGSGLGIGMAMSLLTRQILANELFGIHFLDLPVYVGVILILATVALAAAAFPARRAASIDPMQTLRME